MKLGKPLQLQIFFLSKEAIDAKHLGLDADEDNGCELRLLTVYDIDYVLQYNVLVNGQVSSIICSGNTEFVTPLSLKKLNDLIESNI